MQCKYKPFTGLQHPSFQDNNPPLHHVSKMKVTTIIKKNIFKKIHIYHAIRFEENGCHILRLKGIDEW